MDALRKMVVGLLCVLLISLGTIDIVTAENGVDDGTNVEDGGSTPDGGSDDGGAGENDDGTPDDGSDDATGDDLGAGTAFGSPAEAARTENLAKSYVDGLTDDAVSETLAATATEPTAYDESMREELAAQVEADIREMRQEEHMGWGQIAHELGVHPGRLGLGHYKNVDQGFAVDIPDDELAAATELDTSGTPGHGYGRKDGEAVHGAGAGKYGLHSRDKGKGLSGGGSSVTGADKAARGNSSKGERSGDNGRGADKGDSSGKGNNGKGGGSDKGNNGNGKGGGKGKN
ncbi:hypothetical protein [Desulforhopalus singaporensis]|uniref:Uncharacterized protein n=1 Tax=Desulforhopalus singaporensis TaxID=91360 RepID=A0A1H0TZ06_9BACT|nr:hypothetical protein [Desulforhopalus singaporensis]SDP59302.1 hypothetical protein SAMN05660330_03314 [Desulforhopalus singaporensis]